MSLENLSYNDLPGAVGTLLEKVNRLESLLSKKQESTPTEPKEKLLTVRTQRTIGLILKRTKQQMPKKTVRVTLLSIKKKRQVSGVLHKKKL